MMKGCTITELKVKTVYTVRISPEDLVAIVQHMIEDSKLALVAAAQEAFNGVNLEEISNRRAAARLLRKLWDVSGQDLATIRFIVREILGFDGIENYGYFDEKACQVVVVAYHNGDRIN